MLAYSEEKSPARDKIPPNHFNILTMFEFQMIFNDKYNISFYIKICTIYTYIGTRFSRMYTGPQNINNFGKKLNLCKKQQRIRHCRKMGSVATVICFLIFDSAACETVLL